VLLIGEDFIRMGYIVTVTISLFPAPPFSRFSQASKDAIGQRKQKIITARRRKLTFSKPTCVNSWELMMWMCEKMLMLQVMVNMVPLVIPTSICGFLHKIWNGYTKPDENRLC